VAGSLRRDPLVGSAIARWIIYPDSAGMTSMPLRIVGWRDPLVGSAIARWIIHPGTTDATSASLRISVPIAMRDTISICAGSQHGTGDAVRRDQDDQHSER